MYLLNEFIDNLGDLFEGLRDWIEILSETSSDFISMLRTSVGIIPDEIMGLLVISMGVGIVWLVVKILRG